VLGNGQIVQQGTHAELLAQPGLYRELFEAQSAQEQTTPSNS
jgi:ABC-type multidrug transport system fused ATPase/permease subunit